MAQTSVVKVKVQELSKYGYKADGRYVGYSKQLKDSDKARVVPGAEFEAEYYVADSGKEYLNKIIATVSSSFGAATPVVDTDQTKESDASRTKRFTPKFEKKASSTSEGMSKADWAQKDRNMMIGGRSHDAAVIVAAMVNVQSLDVKQALDTYESLLKGMLEVAEVVK